MIEQTDTVYRAYCGAGGCRWCDWDTSPAELSDRTWAHIERTGHTSMCNIEADVHGAGVTAIDE